MSESPTEPAEASPPATGARAPRGQRRALLGNLALSLFTTSIAFLLLEGLGSVLMSARTGKGALYMQEESHSNYDPELGWSHRPNLSLEGLYGPGTRFTTDDRGFRATPAQRPAGTADPLRVVCLGDSFTMGFGVSDEHTFPAQMRAACPGIETVNMGQGGYGVDQAYLWYKRDGRDLDAEVLLFAMVAHDFYRMASDSFIGYAKPALRATEGRLVVENVPVPRTWGVRTPLARVEAFLEELAVVRTARWLRKRLLGAPPTAEQFYGVVDADVFAAAELALDDLVELSRERGARFALVYLPSGDLLSREPTREAAWLEAYAQIRDIPFANLSIEFGRMPPWELAKLFRPDYHYTIEGNRFVAEALLRLLASRFPGFPNCRQGGAATPTRP